MMNVSRLLLSHRIFRILIALFVGVPLLDTVTLVLVGRYIGFWTTVGMVILSGVIGAHLARQQGLAAWRSLQADMAAGRVPTQGLIDCVLILIAGGMMMAPGFLTDIAAIMLLLPAVRARIRQWSRRRIEAALQQRMGGFGAIGRFDR
jgi:UPF0716 protein FxsA